MPRPYQIVPSYLHPHVATYINDNTIFEDEVAPPEEPVRSLHFIVSSEGRDSIFLPFETEPLAREEYGMPNFKYHGQPIYNMYEALKTRQSRVNVMRVMPPDASYANVILVAKVKIDKTSDPKMVVKMTGTSIENLRDISDFSTQIELLEKPTVQSDGFMHIPIAGIHVAGKGDYGNNFRIRITRSPEEDREYPDYGFVRMEVLKNEGTLLRKEILIGSPFYDAHEGDNSLYIEDVVNDMSEGSKIIKLQFIEANMKQIYDLYKKEVDRDTKILQEKFDIFFGLDKDAEEEGTKIKGLELDIDGEGALVVNRVEGIMLLGGDDGKFKYDETKLAERASAIKDAYLKAMDGTTSKVVFSKARMPIDIILDAGYEKDIKKALIALILKRGDAFGYIDAGIIKNIRDGLQWATEMRTFGDRLFSKEFQHGDIRDAYTGKRIPMTSTWFLAQRLPIHFKQYGRHIPFQGELYARITRYLKNSFGPVVDYDDLELKEQLYVNRVNYYETIAENVIIRGTQGTSQNVWSDLSEEHNMHVLLDMKRKVERLVASKLYNFAEPEDRLRFTEEGQRLFAPYVGVQCRTVDIYFDMNKWEEERSILHCYLAVVFRTIAKRGIIEIDINKRV